MKLPAALLLTLGATSALASGVARNQPVEPTPQPELAKPAIAETIPEAIVVVPTQQAEPTVIPELTEAPAPTQIVEPKRELEVTFTKDYCPPCGMG